MGVFKRKNKSGVEGDMWYVDFYDPGGKRIVKAISPSKREAEAYLGKIKASIREGRFFDIKKATKVTFNELLDLVEEKIRDQKFYKNSIRYFIPMLRERFGKKLLSDINYKSLEDFKDERINTPTQHGTPRTKRTVDIELWFIRRVLNKAIRWGMLERNPFEKGEDLFFKVTDRRERALTEEEVRRLTDACPGYLKPVVISGIYTGLRKGDLLSLRWKDIDLEKRIIRLEEAKTGKTRNIVLNEDMIDLLQSLPIRGECVFPGRYGEHLKDVGHSFQTAIKKAGIEQGKGKRKIVFHTLRHTCISLLTERGADMTAVKNYVAHASEEMTKQYTHLSEEYARRTAEILNGLCGVNLVYGNKMETNEQINSIPPANA